MSIPITPKAIVEAIVGNHPQAVLNRLVTLNLVPIGYQVSANGVMELLAKQTITTRENALQLVTQILDVPIDNNGFGGIWLWQQQQTYGMDLKQLVYHIFDGALPKNTMPNTPTKKPCGCGQKAMQRPMQTPPKWIGQVIIGLAIFGLIGVLAAFVRLTIKLFD